MSWVPLDKLQCAEFCFELETDFNRAACGEIFQVINGLLNKVGGPVQVSHRGTQSLKDICKKEWKNSLQQQLTANVITGRTFRECIQFEDSDDVLYIIVHPSPAIVTLSPFLFTRYGQQILPITDAQEISNIVSRVSIEHTFQSANIPEQYKAKCDPENEHLEYKHWFNIHTVSAYKKKFLDRTSVRLRKAIFTFPNVRRGGTVVLGIAEDLSTKEPFVQGLELTEVEECDFSKFLDNFMQTDPVSSQPRIWGDEKTVPKKGAHWNVHYVSVIGHENSTKRHALICIELYHCTGGVFEKIPESYTVTEDGRLQCLTYSDWKKRLPNPDRKTLDADRLASSSVFVANVAGGLDRADEHSPPCGKTDSQLSLQPPKDTYTQPRLNEIPISEVEELLQQTYFMSWSKNKDDWTSYTTNITRDRKEQLKEMELLTMFRPEIPLNFTPRKEVLNRVRDPLTDQAVEHIEEKYKDIKAFAIGHDCWLANIPSDDRAPPAHHIVDLVVIDIAANIHLWVVSEQSNSDEELNELKCYMFHTGRVIKEGIVSLLRRGIVVQCYLYAPGNVYKGTLEEMVLSHCSTETLRYQDIVCSIATMFLSKETYFCRKVQSGIGITMTSQQMEQLLATELCKFNIIEGPPGSGKTFQALRLAVKYKHKCIALCTTIAFKAFFEYQGLRDVHFLRTEKDLLKLLSNRHLDGKSCVLMDDIHNFPCNLPTWRSLFQYIEKHEGVQLYLFADNHIQNFKDTNALANAITALAHHYSDTGSSFNIRSLTEVHRNTRKIASFIQSCAHDLGSDGALKCSHLSEGDDIEVRKLSYIREDTQNNELVKFLRSLLTHEASKSFYLDSDITILVDGQTAEDDAKYFRELLQRMLQTTVHDAGTFPVVGLTVDTVNNYLGLENEVVIMLVPRSHVSQELEDSSLTNPKYRAFVASRAVRRAVFVVEVLTYKVAKTFQFDRLDNISESGKVSKAVRKELPKESLTSPWRVTMLWHKAAGGIYEVAFLDRNLEKKQQHGEVPGLIFCDSSRSRLVVFDQEKVTVPVDSFGVRYVWLLTVRGDHQAVAVMHRSGDVWPGVMFWRVAVTSEQGWQTQEDVPYDAEPRGIAWTPEGHIVLVDARGDLREYEENGRLVWKRIDSNLVSPRRITVDRAGSLYVVDSGGDCISMFTKRGDFIGTTPPDPSTHKMEAPYAMCVSDEGVLYVGHKLEGEGVVSLWRPGDLCGTAIIHLPTRVWSMSLQDEYLAIGCMDGLRLYRVTTHTDDVMLT